MTYRTRLVCISLLQLASWLGVCRTAAADGADATALARRDEGRLLNQIVSPLHLSANLKVLDLRTGEWLPSQLSDPLSARILVVHLWSAGQTSDLTWLREAARRIEAHYTGEVRFLFLAENMTGLDARAAAASPADAKRAQPGAPWPVYLDSGGGLVESLRPYLLGGELHLPMTLLIDSEFVVRHAFVGAITHRRSELVSAVADLLRSAPRRRAMPPAPAQADAPSKTGG